MHGIRYPFDSEGNTTKIICRPINIPPHDGRASARATRWNIKYLKNLKGLCHLASATCDQIACCWNSAIGWCNKDEEKEQARPCSQFGDWAKRIHDKCKDLHGFKYWVSGDYYNYREKVFVVVGESKC
ncbi:hypothetical protein QBC43DRAFT_46150 [Cladorrhinum sp. PSN259]|nr:hypothetical protein QBC43DRAFT_46150 [Cladorrhinum sp. PSN259]